MLPLHTLPSFQVRGERVVNQHDAWVPQIGIRTVTQITGQFTMNEAICVAVTDWL